MSKKQLAEILKIGAQNPPPANATPRRMREWAEGITSHTPLAEKVRIERVNCGPLQADLIRPAGGDPSRLIIYYHGGGFFLFSPRTYRVTTTNLARAAGSAVLVPDYRLGPENPAPAAHDDAFAVYQWALSQGYAPDKVALSGDSAGGNLALATAVRAKDAGLPLPSSLVLLSPWLDFCRGRRFLSQHAGRTDPASPGIGRLQVRLSRQWRPQIIHSHALLCGLRRVAAHARACRQLGKTARRLHHGRWTHEGGRRRRRPENLRGHVPRLAALRADAGRRHGVD
jgi:hypothetical protein